MAAPGEAGGVPARTRNVVVAGIRRTAGRTSRPTVPSSTASVYVSTMKNRTKYKIFVRNRRAELLIDDSTGFRAVWLTVRPSCGRTWTGAALLPDHPGEVWPTGPDDAELRTDSRTRTGSCW